MEILDVIYTECGRLGGAFGFGAFEGGVIYLTAFSLIILKGYDSMRTLIVKKKIDKQEKNPLNINIKVIK